MRVLSSSPFKLLDAYEKGDEASFFGRKREVAQLYNAIFSARLTLLYGASGTGKTSLVKCGLGSKFYDSDWLPLYVLRNRNINDALRESIRKALPAEEQESDLDALTLTDQLNRLYLNYFKTIYLIFDQFEELFIQGEESEQHQFYQDVQILMNSDRQVKILIVMREEWLGHLNSFERVIPALFDNRLRVERIREQILWRSVIPGMIKAAKIQVQEPRQTIPLIIDQIRDPREGIDLADLQVYLDRMYRRAAVEQQSENKEEMVFDLALVQSIGEIKNVLSVFLDEQIQYLEQDLKEKFQMEDSNNVPLDILYALVTNEQTKRNLSFEAILAQMPPDRGITPEILRYCLEQMTEMRLLNLTN